MICAGLANVVHLAVPPSQIPCRLFIYATKPEYETCIPLEWRQEVINQQLFGNLESTDELPINQLIGFVDLVRMIPHNYNLWSLGSKKTAFLVTNAHTFIVPLDINPDEVEQNLDFIELVNTKILIPRHPYLTDNEAELVLPVNMRLYSMASTGAAIFIQLAGEFAKLVLNEYGLLKPFTRYTLWHDNEGKRFVVDADTEIVHELNADGSDLCRYPSMLSPDGMTTRASLRFSCRFPLND